jgi:starch synthase
MYALRYGTIPLVRAVGGLHDTVTEYQPKSGKGSGFKFNGYEKEALIETVRKALTLYQTKSAWKKLIKNAFAEDFSWPVTADKYLQIYRKVI